MSKRSSLLGIFFWTIAIAHAQTEGVRPSLSIETRITNYFQGGYEVSAFWNTRGHFSFGVQLAGQRLKGNSKDFVFESSNYDQLDIQMAWLAAYKTRYHLRKHHEGLYGEISIGGEEFTIKSGVEKQKIRNGFILPSVGYLWHPWGRKGFYAVATIGYDFIVGGDGEKTINGTTYQLKRSFPVPTLSLGWKF